ncbi:hypothetical protein GYB57_04765 [bacterium]|nr:hypothetical protein [bacterium]
MKYKIALSFCFFLILAPFIGSFLTDNTFGTYIANFTPYVHFGISTVGGFPFADAIAGIFGLFLMIIEVIGLLLFVFSRFKKTAGLRLILYMTVIYCSFRFLGSIAMNISHFSRYDTSNLIFVIASICSEIFWIIICFWSIKQLEKKDLKTIESNKLKNH